MNDTQIELDQQQAADFRRMVTRLRSDIQRRRLAEAKLRKLHKKARKDREQLEKREENYIAANDAATDLDFVNALQDIQDQVEDAQNAEAEAANAFREERIKRKQAQLELQVSIKKFVAPLPLFDRKPVRPASDQPSVEKADETEKPARGRKKA